MPDILIPNKNKKMMEGGQVLTYGYLLAWLGMQLVIGKHSSFQLFNFCSNNKIDTFETAPYLSNDIIPWIRFDETLKVLTINDKIPP